MRFPGQGIHFIGFPTDIDQFNWILNKEGCHPKAAKRILDRLKLNGEDKLTVMEHLNFIWIRKELLKINVNMLFIDPIEFKEKNDGEWPKELLDKILKSK